jgi:hypothetical protein
MSVTPQDVATNESVSLALACTFLPSEIDEAPSHLKVLLERFVSSPFYAAPERAQELKKISEDTGTFIRVNTHNSDWRFEEGTLSGQHISCSTTELLRGYGHTATPATAIITELTVAGSGGYSDIKNKVEFGCAYQLIRWAAQTERVDIEEGWPQGLPSPGNRDFAHTETANRIFLMTCARILLHEIGHAVNKHKPADAATMFAQEHEADCWADEWMLSNWQEYNSDEKVFIQRSLGVAFSYAPALIFGAVRESPSDSHPTSGDRVLVYVRRYYANANPRPRRSETFHAHFCSSSRCTCFFRKGR